MSLLTVNSLLVLLISLRTNLIELTHETESSILQLTINPLDSYKVGRTYT